MFFLEVNNNHKNDALIGYRDDIILKLLESDDDGQVYTLNGYNQCHNNDYKHEHGRHRKMQNHIMEKNKDLDYHQQYMKKEKNRKNEKEDIKHHKNEIHFLVYVNDDNPNHYHIEEKNSNNQEK